MPVSTSHLVKGVAFILSNIPILPTTDYIVTVHYIFYATRFNFKKWYNYFAYVTPTLHEVKHNKGFIWEHLNENCLSNRPVISIWNISRTLHFIYHHFFLFGHVWAIVCFLDELNDLLKSWGCFDVQCMSEGWTIFLYSPFL